MINFMQQEKSSSNQIPFTGRLIRLVLIFSATTHQYNENMYTDQYNKDMYTDQYNEDMYMDQYNKNMYTDQYNENMYNDSFEIKAKMQSE